MKAKEKRKAQEEPEESSGGGKVLPRRYVRTPSGSFVPANERLLPDERLLAAVGTTLRKIEAVRAATRKDDEEIARLGEETRRLIGEIQRELNLKAA
jgi:hypothetical protein